MAKNGFVFYPSTAKTTQVDRWDRSRPVEQRNPKGDQTETCFTKVTVKYLFLHGAGKIELMVTDMDRPTGQRGGKRPPTR
jgi:hypothetical protein